MEVRVNEHSTHNKEILQALSECTLAHGGIPSVQRPETVELQSLSTDAILFALGSSVFQQRVPLMIRP